MYLKIYNTYRMSWLEVVLALLASNGIFYLIAQKLFENRLKKMEYEYKLSKDNLDFEQKMKEKEDTKESLTRSLQKLATGKDFLNDVTEKFSSDWATIIKMHNGEKYGDGQHKWKFSATIESVKGIDKGVFKILQQKPVGEAGLLFPTLKETNYIHVNIQDEKPTTTLSERLSRKGVVAYTVVSTPDLMNSLMLCWFDKAELNLSGVDISESTLKQIMGDFQSMEGQLL